MLAYLKRRKGCAVEHKKFASANPQLVRLHHIFARGVFFDLRSLEISLEMLSGFKISSSIIEDAV